MSYRINSRVPFSPSRPVTPFTIGTTEQILPTQYQPAQSLVLWRWNESDTSQFDASPFVQSAGPPQFSSTTLSVRTTGSVGRRLRIEAGIPDLTDSAALFRILDLPELPDRYILRYRIAASDNDSNWRFGWFRHNNSASLYGYGMQRRGAAVGGMVFLRAENSPGTFGPFSTPGGGFATAGVNDNSFEPSYGHMVEEEHIIDAATGSTPPRFILGHSIKMSGVPSTNPPDQGCTSDDIIGAVPAAGWTGKATPGLGITIRASNVSGVSITRMVEFADMQILVHPMDW